MIAPLTAPTTVSTTPQGLQHQKLVNAAQHFEAIFLQEMLKPFAPDKDDGADEDSQDASGTQGTYQSMGVESMAAAISRAGGLGIARSVVASVERSSMPGLSLSNLRRKAKVLSHPADTKL